MALKVFYSWQSDTEAKVNRTFIREALEAAIAGLDLEDAERTEIDQDTKGVLGSPVIADTIFKKIKAAAVVVADVTLTGRTAAGKPVCNSNVAIELGYALGVHGDSVLLKVMNTHYGSASELPFDLAHRRWPVQYDLSPDAEPADRNKARDALIHELRQILGLYFRAARHNQSMQAGESDATKKADLRADFLKYGSNNYRFKISNRGPASARNVRVEFPDGNDCIIESELIDKLPFELLERHQAVELIAAVSSDTRSKHKVKLLWDDEFRLNNEKIVYATI